MKICIVVFICVLTLLSSTHINDLKAVARLDAEYRPDQHDDLLYMIDASEVDGIMQFMSETGFHPSTFNEMVMRYACRSGSIELARFCISYLDYYPANDLLILCIDMNQPVIFDLIFTNPNVAASKEEISSLLTKICSIGNTQFLRSVCESGKIDVGYFAKTMISTALNCEHIAMIKFNSNILP